MRGSDCVRGELTVLGNVGPTLEPISRMELSKVQEGPD